MKILNAVNVKVINIDKLVDNKTFNCSSLLRDKQTDSSERYLKSERINIKMLKQFIDNNFTEIKVRSRRYDIINLHDLDQSLNNIIHDININIEKRCFK